MTSRTIKYSLYTAMWHQMAKKKKKNSDLYKCLSSVPASVSASSSTKQDYILVNLNKKSFIFHYIYVL